MVNFANHRSKYVDTATVRKLNISNILRGIGIRDNKNKGRIVETRIKIHVCINYS